MTEVWWCAVHFSGYAIDPENHAEEGRICYKAALLDSHGCIGVPRRLVPVDALVIVRDAEGNWPQWALGVLVNILFVGPVPNWDAAALDALAEAARINLQ